MKRILIQLDTDPLPSSFDRVVAADSDVDELFSYGGITTDNVEPLIHGAIFTRGPGDLNNTAVFVGGSEVIAGEDLFARVQKAFFGPMRVSVMMDSNGSNTTAAAAVLAAKRHINLSGCEAIVLGGTGPVGQRAAQLLAMQGARVRVASRSVERAQTTCDVVAAAVDGAQLTPVAWDSANAVATCEGVQVVIAAGTVGVELLSEEARRAIPTLQVAIDLNAVPPVGLGGIEVMDKAQERDGVICYGAIGVGGTKMKIHKAAVRKLFEANDQVFDTSVIFDIDMALEN